MIPSDETRRKLSEAQKKRWECPEARKKNGEISLNVNLGQTL